MVFFEREWRPERFLEILGMNAKRITRRSFFRRSAAATAAAPLVLSARAFGANERISMGFIGMGGQGRGDMGALMNFDEVQAVAVCDVVDEHMDMARNQVNSHYGNKDCRTYRDWRDIIARDDIDTVFIGTPDHWHAILAVQAANAGKDIYCEKPMTHDLAEGRAVVPCSS